jgi:hypothetical protein
MRFCPLATTASFTPHPQRLFVESQRMGTSQPSDASPFASAKPAAHCTAVHVLGLEHAVHAPCGTEGQPASQPSDAIWLASKRLAKHVTLPVHVSRATHVAHVPKATSAQPASQPSVASLLRSKRLASHVRVVHV